MGAIGDYIHYHAFLYQVYGTNRPKGTKTYDYGNPERVFASQQDRIRGNLKKQAAESLTREEKESLKKRIANIFSPEKNKDHDVQAIRQAVIDQLEEDFWRDINVNWETGNATVTESQLQTAKGNTESVIRYSQNTKSIRLQTIQSRITYIKEIIKNNLVGATVRGKMETALQDIQTQLDAIKKEGDKSITLDQGGAAENLVSSINNAIRKINASVQDMNVKGQLFEYVNAAAMGTAQQIVQSGIQDTITKLTVGNEKNIITTNKDAFADFIDLEKFADSSIEIPLDFKHPQSKKMKIQTSINKSSSNGKVDVLFDLGDLNDMEAGGISAKSLQLESGMSSYNVSLVSESPLYNFIQNQNADFINHYFNLVAEHPDSDYIKDSSYWIKIWEAHETMRMTLLYQAFTGDIYHAQGSKNINLASVFVVNDNTVTGPSSIHIYTIGDLVESAMEAIGTYVEVTANNMNFEDVKIINNYYESGYKTRISTLIAYTHALKIKVSISPSLLMDTSGWF